MRRLPNARRLRTAVTLSLAVQMILSGVLAGAGTVVNYPEGGIKGVADKNLVDRRYHILGR